jgi:hypothetical protein
VTEEGPATDDGAVGRSGPEGGCEEVVVERRLLVAVALCALAAMPALGTAAERGGGEAAAHAHPHKPALTRFTSCDRFARYARSRALEIVGPWGFGGPPVPLAAPVAAPEADRAVGGSTPAPATAPQPGVDYSDTNVQEAGVDEPDTVKTDGRTIFAIAGGTVEVVDVSGAAPRLLTHLELDDISPSGLLLVGDRLLVLGSSGSGFPVPVATGVVSDRLVAPIGPARTVAVQVDVSDPAKPQVLSRLTVDGSLVSARRTEGTVRLVVSSSPTYLPLAVPEGGAARSVRVALRANRRAVKRANASAWLPRLRLRDAATRRTTRRVAVSCKAVSRPAQFSGLGTVTVLTLGASGKLQVLDSDAILTDADLVYASPKAMYVATPRYADPSAATDPQPPGGSTLIHKLDTSDPSATVYRASGAVRGYLLNQFAMSEQDGFLRTASTAEPDWWQPPSGDNTSQSFVTVLAQQGDRLIPVGSVTGLAKGERIFAVRFLGDRGYVVTFRQVDPLFALDLSDPARPAVRGTLKIPGFSSYLHPVDPNLLIGVGQAADETGRAEGTQVSLFDVSDLANPRRIAQRTLNVDWSAAETDHHAFLYWAPTKLLVLPVQNYDSLGRGAFLGAVGLRVDPATGITPIGRVEHPHSASSFDPVTRSVVVGPALYTLSDAGILGSDLDTLAPRGFVTFR